LVSSVACGTTTFTFKVESLSTVTTMKKNNSMNMISGNDAVDIAGEDFPLFLVNLPIFITYFSSPKLVGSASERTRGILALISFCFSRDKYSNALP